MRIKTNGCRTYYKQVNEDGSATVIFIHGFPFSHKMWLEQLGILPPHIRGIAYDVRGHGYSEVGDGLYTIELFVDDLSALMAKLNVERAILCGLSMGGYIALRFAAKYPEKVNGLVLCDTRAEADGNEAKLKRASSIQKVKEEGIEAFADEFVKAVLFAGSMENKKLVQKVHKMIVDTSPVAVGGTQLALASRIDSKDVLDEIKLPTLIMVGEEDAVTPPIAAETLHEGIAGSKLEVIPMAGHMSNLENPSIFNKALISFLRQYK